jgi:hypothetical protein
LHPDCGNIAVPLQLKIAKLGCTSAIQVNLIAFGLHELCTVKQKNMNDGRQD